MPTAHAATQTANATARNSRLHAPDRPRGLLEPCAATSGKHGSEEGSAGKRRSLSDHVVLEAAGLTVQLVNARPVKNVPGRAKTDKKDAVWLARLTERGMLQPSFVPPYDIRRLREYTRLRADPVHDRTRYWARLEKLLERALIKVSAVASSLAAQSDGQCWRR